MFIYDTLPYLSGPQDSGKCWYLSVLDNGWNGDVWVESPVYNLEALSNPIVSMDIKYQLTGGNNNVILQYSNNGGSTWTTLGSFGDANWYNSGTNGGSWNNNINNPVSGWTKVQHIMCPMIGQPCVKFRITTNSLYYNGDNAYFAFDNFRIQDRPDIGIESWCYGYYCTCNIRM